METDEEMHSPGLLNRTVARAEAEESRVTPAQTNARQITPQKDSLPKVPMLTIKKRPEELACAYWLGMKTRKVLNCQRMKNN